MSCCFFLSYAPNDRVKGESFIDKFFDDLCREVGLRVPYHPPGDLIGFFDREMSGGGDWKTTILRSLRESRVLVCLFQAHFTKIDSEEDGNGLLLLS